MTRVEIGRTACALLLLVLAASSAVPAAAGPRVESFFGKDALPYSWVTGVFRDGDDLWVGTKSGTRIYSLAGRTWRTPPEGFSDAVLTGLARFGDRLYAATDRGLLVGGPEGWQKVPRIQNAAAENGDFAASPEKLWMAARTMVGGLLEYDGTDWKLLTRGPGTGVMNNITRLAVWKGELWAGTLNNGIYRMKSGAWEVLGPEDGLPAIWVTSLAATGEGVYAGTPEGLGFFDGTGWRTYTTKDGLPSNKISVLKVLDGRLAVGTFDRGMSIFDGQRFQTIGQAEGLSDNRVEAIEPAEGGAVWVGTVNGLNLVRTN